MGREGVFDAVASRMERTLQAQRFSQRHGEQNCIGYHTMREVEKELKLYCVEEGETDSCSARQ